MFGELDEVIRKQIEVSEGGHKANKVMPLEEAVRKFVRPGMSIHVGHSYACPSAACREIIRQFWGKNPNFTLSTLGFISDLALFFFGNLVKRTIATFYGDSYPMPGPNPIYQKAYREGTVSMENWSILSFSLRLLAGALGLDFIPVNSLLGTTMEEENAKDYFKIEAPDGKVMGLARAIEPDLAFLHGWASDPAGNVIISPPYAEGATSARAAKEGTIVTVERIVSADFIKRYSHLVKIPSYLVKAVCLAPFGTHPGGLSNYGLEGELIGYEVDRDFIIHFREQCKDEKKLQNWADKWVLGCKNNEEYLFKLGHERISFLRGNSSKEAWESEIANTIPEMNLTEEFNPTEMMVVVGARVIAEKIRKQELRTILAGVGASNLAAWVAYYNLMEEEYDTDLMAEIGFFGYSPQPADPYIFNLKNVPQCRMLTDVNDILGSIVGAKTSKCIGALGAGQVDRCGNVNSTAIPQAKFFLVGSGGAADVQAGAREIVILTEHSPARLVGEVPYITCPGEKIKTVVTTKGILEKRDGEFVLTGYFPLDPGKDEETTVGEIVKECGWELKVAPKLERVELPSLNELLKVRTFDPHRFFLGEE
ncbi:MAG: hypothetical protein PHP64_02115 [Actinomycetota bacterium]|nr:hypothetical protein [Actinomycetota bacterium]